MLIVMRQELGLVSRHIDIDRTIALAAFAGQAQVERLFHFLALPHILDDFTAHGLEQQARTAARGMLFFAGRLVAGAHGLRMLLAAIADADTTQGDTAEVSLVFGILEMCLRLRRIVAGAQAQIFVSADRHRRFFPDSFSSPDPRWP